MKRKTISRHLPVTQGRRWSASTLVFLRLCLCLSVSFGTSLIAPVSTAHQQKTAVTRILFNSNTGNIEVMHRFLLHDAEHAANLIFGQREGLLESAESRELFASYVVNRFAIEANPTSADPIELKLEYIGEEIDGQFLWVYQETVNSFEISGLRVFNTALRDVWPEQQNLVNIEKDGEIVSLSFSAATEILSIAL